MVCISVTFLKGKKQKKKVRLVNLNELIFSFQFETCCVIDSIVKPYVNHQLLVMYTLEAETFNNQRTSSRIWFDEFQSRNQKIVKNLTIFNNNGESCQTHIAFLKVPNLEMKLVQNESNLIIKFIY